MQQMNYDSVLPIANLIREIHAQLSLDHVFRHVTSRERKMFDVLRNSLDPFISLILSRTNAQRHADNHVSRLPNPQILRPRHAENTEFMQDNILSTFRQLFLPVISRPEEKKEMKTANLDIGVFHLNNLETQDRECGICKTEFNELQNIAKTTCCGTKVFCIKCAVQCLRSSDVCPFCRSAKIGFS